MTTLPRKITLTYTLSVPISFQDFVEFVNKDREEERQLTTQDELAREIWAFFVQTMKEKDKKIPSGRDVDINHEPDHECVFAVQELINDAVQEVEDSDDEEEAGGEN